MIKLNNAKTTYLKSIIILFVLVNISNNSSAQYVKPLLNAFMKTDNKEFNIGHTKLNSISSTNNTSNHHSIQPDYPSYSNIDCDRLTKPNLRFDINFVKVDPYLFSGVGNNRLSIIRNGYEPYYSNPYNQPSFTGDLIMGLLESCLINLR